MDAGNIFLCHEPLTLFVPREGNVVAGDTVPTASSFRDPLTNLGRDLWLSFSRDRERSRIVI